MSESSPYEKETRKLFYLGANQWLTWRDLHRSALKDIAAKLLEEFSTDDAKKAISIVKDRL